ncbi:MAG: LysM peptidoglycan-binding domain-containing protein [Anaerolineales bacterium]
MNRWKRLAYYLLINVGVSACTILTVLFVWERVNRSDVVTPTPAVQNMSSTATVQGGDATPTDAPSPSPTTAHESYQVQSGDTLGTIADRFGVTIEAIIETNELENPDILSVGDVLIIPLPPDPDAPPPTVVPETPPATRTPPPTLPAGQTSTPLPPGFDPQLEIVTVVGAGNLEDERVVIKLNADVEISLRGWRLEGNDGNVYVFPELTLFKGGAVTISTKTGVDTVVALYWGLEKSVWEEGEVVLLIDPQGNVQASYQIP